MKRLCIFAHWDKDNIVDDYVIYYLNALNEISDYIIFVSDSDLSTDEIQKIKGVASFIQAKEHGEYDFGSYKRGLLIAKESGLKFDELLLVNDSCFGPFYPLKNIFEKMDRKKCDFWGMTQNSFGLKLTPKGQSFCYAPHLQSYFILLKSNTFKVVEDFLNSVKKEDTKEEVIINYEMQLSKILNKNGFRQASFIEAFKHTENCTLFKWDSLIQKYEFPFLKTSIVRTTPIEDNIIPSTYPKEYIQNYQKRYKNSANISTPDLLPKREQFLNFARKNLPFEIYLGVRLFDRKIISTFCRLFRYIIKHF